jgi:Rrf2 family protein
MLTKRAKYGLKALLRLAQQHHSGPMLIAELAELDGIPRKFLEAILLDLNRHGLVISRKGPGGGYLLRHPPDQITAGQVIRVLDGPLALVPCASQTAYQACDDCPDEDDCAVRTLFKSVRDETARILDGTTLAAIADSITARKAIS